MINADIKGLFKSPKGFIFAAVMILAMSISLSACLKPGSSEASGSTASSYEFASVDPEEFSKNKGEWDVKGLSLPSIFDNGMILQRDQAIHVYGESTNGEEVTVTFNGESYTTKASELNGSFIVSIPPCPAGRDYTLSVTSEGKTITYTDILVGDVFLCGGQSNMQLTMDDTEWYGDHYISRFDTFENEPEIRQLLIEFGASAEVQFDCMTIGWKSANKDTFKKFSPLAYYFAANLHRELDIPVGLVMCSAGGSAIQLWMPKEDQVFEGDSDSTFYDQRALLYNNMLAPVIPFSYAGVLWYQGEANASYDKAGTYEILLPNLIGAWRREAFDPHIPFYVVELAGYNDDRFAILREEQHKVCDSLENVYLIPNYDLGAASDIHPKTKDVLSERIVKTYLATKLGRNAQFKAPEIIKADINNGSVVLTFENVYDGLKSDSQTIRGFMLAGTDGVFYNADTVLQGKDKVVITCTQVSEPTAVRYCYVGFSKDVDLYNSADMPLLPYQTYPLD